jgi:SAM-dependent methyltransferase
MNTIRSFSSVDTAPAASELIDAMDHIAAVAAVQRLRATATRMLDPKPGDHIVDVGCGLGDQVRLLAAAVGPTGSVVGIDPSTTMLDIARRRTDDRHHQIEFRTGDATALDLPDGSVDGVRCERVFQHLVEPEAAMAELARITRPGGRIVVIDSDWGMHAIHGADPDLTGRVIRCWADSAANGLAGRGLSALFTAAGLHDVDVAAETMTSTDRTRPMRAPFPQLAATALERGVLTAAQAATWLDDLVTSAHAGRFFWAATMIAVVGRR